MHRPPALLIGIAVTATGILLPVAGLSQFDNLNIYSDPQGTDCLISDVQPGTITVYLFHQATTGATACQFRIVTEGGFTGIYLTHQPAPGFLDLGTPPTDYSVAYGSCTTGRFLISSITYFGAGSSPSCSRLSLEPAPTSPLPGELAVVDCALEVHVGFSFGPAIVNFDGTCYPFCIGATEPSSWGKIKALYR